MHSGVEPQPGATHPFYHYIGRPALVVHLQKCRPACKNKQQQQQPSFYGHHTGQRALAGTSS